ncbi:lasso peptide biosynthesis B2 protein [Terriglobus sp. 2YAB30_2]|uniref:lasso peptide biosynthesis B2 protein n=1 Tax=unclassified Terriglobus TaxID=2628988 RepID=UPI003F98EE56
MSLSSKSRTSKFGSWREIPIAAEATAWLFFSWLVLDVLPGKLYRHCMQPRLRAREFTEEQGLRQIKRVSWAVQRTSIRLPWRSVCFHRGIAAHQMLRRRGIASTLHYGVNPKEKLAAHVWVTAGGRPVVGVREAVGYTQIAVFPDTAKNKGTSVLNTHASFR